MATIELVEQLREYANVSYKDAKEALDITNNDILEAIIYLESHGKIEPPKDSGSYTTQKQNIRNSYRAENRASRTTLGDLLKKFWKWLVVAIKKGNSNLFVIHRYDKEIMSMPITVLVTLIIACFWLTLPLMLVGLFFDFKYNFYGPDITSTSINDIMDKTSDTVENVKTNFKDNKANSDPGTHDDDTKI